MTIDVANECPPHDPEDIWKRVWTCRKCGFTGLKNESENHSWKVLHREDTFEKFYYKHYERHGVKDDFAFTKHSMKFAYERGKHPDNANPD